MDGLDKPCRITNQPHAVEVAGLVAGGRTVAGDDAGGGDAVTVMRQEATKMKVLDTHNDVPSRLYGICEVVAANPDADVIINGNMTFDTVRYAGEGAVVVNGFNRHRYITKQCHGRLVLGSRLLPGYSDNPSSTVFVGGLRGSDLAGINGKYLAMKGKGDFFF